MFRTKLTIGVLIGIIAVLATALGITLSSVGNSHEADQREDILHHFDRTDIRRLDEMVKRHGEGKGDYLLLIPRTVDGGYWIHDVHSNGREITWTIDNTRDGMSSEQGKRTYKCKVISKSETGEHHVYTLEQCDNEERSLPIFSISKER
jgi:hypothetical protein